MLLLLFFFFKQKTAYEMRISDWSSDVCSSDLQSRPELIVEGFISHAEAAGDGKTFGLSQRFLERPACVLVLIVAFGPCRCGYPRCRDGGQQKKTSDRKSTRLNSSH